MSKYKWVLVFNKIKCAQNNAKGRRNTIGKNFWRPKYEEYLQSPEWAEKRKECIKIHGDKCVNCNMNYQHVHHLSYERLGNENPEFDLIPLCSSCHKKVHNPSLRDINDFLLSEAVKPSIVVNKPKIDEENKKNNNESRGLREQLRISRRRIKGGKK